MKPTHAAIGIMFAFQEHFGLQTLEKNFEKGLDVTISLPGHRNIK
jgi:hypothetical protein